MSEPRVAVLTDSTASLPAALSNARGIEVVPLQVIIGSQVFDEGDDEGASPQAVARALREFVPVSTSRPAPATLVDVYERIAAAGAGAIVSIHLSAEVSGTFESAQLAARQASIPVIAVDSAQVGPATGFAVLSAAAMRDRGGTAEEVAEAARRRAEQAVSIFYVDTLEYLRRGGRVGTAAALLGSALSVKPLLTLADGHVVTKEKVRTAARALARLRELAVAAAGSDQIDLTVAHLASPERAEDLHRDLTTALAANLGGRTAGCTELGGVLGAHVGPGMVAVCVAPRLDTD